MHYYKRNLGDYAKKAGRLSMLQHGAYTLLIDACYDREQFPTLDEALEWTWASTTEEIESVSFVLRKFFDLVDGVYVQNRIQEEIDGYHSKAETNTRIALEREAKRKGNLTNCARTVNEAPPNQEPRTINQEPLTKNHKKENTRTSALACPAEVHQQIWDDWLSLRKAKRAPVTETVLNTSKTEAKKAGMTLEEFLREWVSRGSQGLKAEWIKPQGRTQAPSKLDGYLSNFKDKDRENERDITGIAVRVD